MPRLAFWAAACVLVLPCRLADSLEITFIAPPRARDRKEVVCFIVRNAARDLEDRFGLSLPGSVTVRLTGGDEITRIVSGGGRVRYDGVALAHRNEVLVDIESGSIVDLLTVLRHELFHVAASPLNLPRWLDEGLAMCFSGNLFPADPGGFGAGPLNPPDVTPPVSTLDYLFVSDDPAVVRTAYMDSFAVTAAVIDRIGDDGMRRLLAARRAAPDAEFETILRKNAHVDVDEIYRAINLKRNPRGVGRILNSLAKIPPFAYLALLLVVGGILKRKRLKELLLRQDSGISEDWL
ncbi:MAG: hypothetical protein JW909_01725 [Planctomycetes bacterium]|nr:hypothetical protein [Planctomycetota bacterium]